MANELNTGGPKMNGALINVTSIFFERIIDGSWTATIDTDHGEIAGSGASILEARLALDELLKRRQSELAVRAPQGPSEHQYPVAT